MGCVTLLSDFGLVDASVASVKGILMQHNPGLPIIDISHSVEPFHLQQAAYILASAYKNFPAGSIHLVLFDVFSEKEPRFLLCENEGHYFLAPDNGILSLAFTEAQNEVWSCFELKKEHSLKDWLHRASELVHLLQTNRPGDLQLENCELKNAPVHWHPKVDGNTVECHVIHIDRFENVVINMTRELFESMIKGKTFRIQFMRDEGLATLSKHYTDEREGAKLCRFNSSGFMEIAINRGKAASLFGLRLHQKQHVIYNTIKLFFE